MTSFEPGWGRPSSRISGRFVLGSITSALLLAASADAGTRPAETAPSSSLQASAKRKYRAARAPQAPNIDGLLDERSWAEGDWGSVFTQREPYEGRPPSEPTDFQILFDDENLYVAIRAHDADAEHIERRVTRRDDRQGDQVEVYLDTYFDHLTAFVFNVNSAGVKSDFLVTGDGAQEDESWDAVWHARVAVSSSGWTAEMAIPFTQLRFGASHPRIWGLQVRRRLHRREEISEWQAVPREASGLVRHFGELFGLDDVPAHRQLEILPYALSELERYAAEEGNPFSTGAAESLTGGVDGKLAATSDLMLTFTASPDFGQVEADPSEVNLTTFETFFPEKRPFFIEGANILDYTLVSDGGFGQDNLFYSRRIGRAPQRSIELESDEYSSAPRSTTILGAAKLTGKTRGGWSIGLLDAVTAEERARVDTLGVRREEVIEPLTNYLVARIQKDFDEGATLVGGMFTATNRDEQVADLSELHRSAYTAGFDFLHAFHDRSYYVSGKAVVSEVRGTEDAILATQRSSRRYFQRPDAEHLVLDPTRTSLAGYGGTFDFGKNGGGHLRFSAGTTFRSPGLELNDVGFQRTADQVFQWSYAGWRIFEPFSVFRTFDVNVNQWRSWDFGGTRLFDGLGANVQMQLKNYWSVASGVNHSGESVANQALRGGPSLRLPGGWGQWINVRSDSRRRLGFYAGGWNFWGDDGSARTWESWTGLTFRPTSAASVSVEPRLYRDRRDLQYVETVGITAGSESDLGDERFIFGSLDQTTFGVTVRLSYSVTPDLSVQFYGQPFLSQGGYGGFKRITEPGAPSYADRFVSYLPTEIVFDPRNDEFTVAEREGTPLYRFGNPDFDFHQLRSNLVLRWEYTPGSTLYVVWSQERTGEREGENRWPSPAFSVRRGLGELYRLQPYNVFLVKLSYRFAM